MKICTVARFALAIMVGAGCSGAFANVVTGNLWKVPEAVALEAVPSNIPERTADVTFDVNSPLSFRGTGVSVGTWLGSGSAFNITENTAGTLSSPMDDRTFGSLLAFTGEVTVTNGQQFTVTHDDGLTLIIDDINLDFSPGPTAPITSIATYTGPSGIFDFLMVYAECCAGAAVLQVDLPFSNDPSPVPEPLSLALVGLGLAGIGLSRRKRA